jgi:tetratricopeptide (TPR) repeat protein
MRLAAAIGLAAALFWRPAHAAPESCAAVTPKSAMVDCLLEKAEAVIASSALSGEPETAAIFRDYAAQVAAATGDVARLRGYADLVEQDRYRARILGMLAETLAAQGDAAGAEAALVRIPIDQPVRRSVEPQVLAALGDADRMRERLAAASPRGRIVLLLGLVDALREKKQYRLAGELLDAFGEPAPAGPPIPISFAPTAIALVEADRLDLARKVAPLLTASDRQRMEAYLALQLDAQGKRQEATALLEGLVQAAPRFTGARLALALIAVRHGDLAAARAAFPKALAYDRELLGRFWPLLATADGQGTAASLIGTMNNGKDRVAAYARMALLLAQAGEKEAAADFLAKARAIVEPVVELEHGAAPQLIDYGPALGAVVEAMVALGQVDAARDFIARLEKAVQDDPFGLARPGIMRGLVLASRALFAHLIAAGDDEAVLAAATTGWRRTAARDALLEAGKAAEAVRLAEGGDGKPVAKASDFLAVAQYIAEH